MASKNKSHYLYHTWREMRRRCEKPSHPDYPRYGGLGVTISDRWTSNPGGFENFLSDMGDRPDGCTLDRIDPYGNYGPDNCRWADRATQSSNRRVPVNGMKLTAGRVSIIKAMRQTGRKYKDIASVYKVSTKTVEKIGYGEHWWYVQPARLIPVSASQLAR